MIKSAPSKRSIVIFAKYPEPGKVKTRLGNSLGHDHSFMIYEAMLLDMIDKLALQNLYSCCFYIFPPEATNAFSAKYCLDNDRVFPQEGFDLGERMFNSFVHQISLGSDQVICIGSDIPAISLVDLDSAFSILSTHDAVLGPAEDGGYYLIGINKKAISNSFFSDISWSTSSVFSETISKMENIGLSYNSIHPLRDLDDLSDLIFFKDLLNKQASLSPRLNMILNTYINGGFPNGV